MPTIPPVQDSPADEGACEPGLAMLLIDVLAGGSDEAEQLARYAQDPALLSPADRASIERRLAESPAVADQLRVLRRLTSRS